MKWVYLLAAGCLGFHLVSSSAHAADLAPTSAPAITMPAKEVRIDLVRVRDRLLVPTKVNGRDAGLFLVDTGAESVHIDVANATKMDLPIVGTASIRGFGGTAAGQRLLANEISVGEVSLRPMFVVSTDLSTSSLKATGQEVAGIIGTAFLEHFIFRLSGREASLTLYDRSTFTPPTGAKRFELRMQGRIPAIYADFEDHSFSGWFACDTGSDSWLYFQPGYVQLNRAKLVDRPFQPSQALGIGGDADERAITLSDVQMLGSRRVSQPAHYSVLETGKVSPLSAGHVGMPNLELFDLTFDYKGGAVWVVEHDEFHPMEWDDAKFDPRKPDAGGITPLMFALLLRQTEYAKKFLAAGVDVNATDAGGATALHYAAHRGNADLVNALLAAGASVSAKTTEGTNPLHVAARRSSVKIVTALLAADAKIDEMDDKGFTALVAAAGVPEQSEVVAALIKAGANCNSKTVAQGTALHQAAAGGATKSAELLLNAGADPNATNGKPKVTPLILACLFENIDVVKVLLAHGAAVNEFDADGHTALTAAAAMRRPDIARLLLATGADKSIREKGGKNALDYAAASGNFELVSLLYTRPSTAPASQPASN